MKTKLLIGGVAIVLIGTVFYFIQPKEVVAPEPQTDGQLETPSEIATTTSEDTLPAETSTTPTQQTPVAQPSTKPSTYTPPAPKTSPLPYTALVSYDGKRFLPETVTIIEGGTVRFLNTGDIKLWVASDNHPTHDRYPVKSDNDCAGSSFDQCTSILNGGSWSFTFTRTGTWGYHNHLRAQDTGEIVVMTKEEYIKKYR